jgi:hypothetical protein
MSTSNVLSASIVDAPYDPGDISEVFANVDLMFAYSRFVGAGCIDPLDTRDAIVYLASRRLLVELQIVNSMNDVHAVQFETLDSFQTLLLRAAWNAIRHALPIHKEIIYEYGSEVLHGMSYLSARGHADQMALRVTSERLRAWKKHFNGVSNMCEHYVDDHPLPAEVAMAVAVRHVHSYSTRFHAGLLADPGVLRISTTGESGIVPHPFATLFGSWFKSNGQLRVKSRQHFQFPSPGYFLAVAMRLNAYNYQRESFVLAGECFDAIESTSTISLDSSAPASGTLTSYLRYLCEVFHYHKSGGRLDVFVQRRLSNHGGIGICDVVNGVFAGVFIPDARESLTLAIALLNRFGLEFASLKNPRVVPPHHYLTWGSWLGDMAVLPLVVTYAPEK